MPAKSLLSMITRPLIGHVHRIRDDGFDIHERTCTADLLFTRGYSHASTLALAFMTWIVVFLTPIWLVVS